MRDDWSVKEILQRDTGKVERLYYYKRKPCNRVALTSPMALQLAGYALIEKDLRSILFWIDQIDKIHTPHNKQNPNDIYGHSNDRETYNLIKGLFVAALTFYGKCFSQCEGRRAKLERKNIDKKFIDAHDQAMSFRHNFAAHSGAAKLEKVDIALVIPQKNDVGYRIYKELWQPDLLWHDEDKDDVSLKALVEHVQSIAIAKMRKLDQLIMEREVAPKDHNYWKKK